MDISEKIKKALECRIRLTERLCDSLCSKCQFSVPELSYKEIYCVVLNYIQQLERSYDVHRQIIEELNLYIAAWGVHQHEWVSVKDRQPCVEECRYLICLNDGFIATAIWDNGWNLWADAGEVTHWMPLPEPPKEG